jgi:hypothetical protein
MPVLQRIMSGLGRSISCGAMAGALVLIGARSAPAAQGLIVEQDVTLPGGRSSHMSSEYKGAAVRTMISPQAISLQLEDGRNVMLLVQQKMYMTMPVATAAAPASQPSGPASTSKIVDTGQKQKIGDYQAEGYEVQSSDPNISKMTFWMAKDYPNAKAILAAMKAARMRAGAAGGPGGRGRGPAMGGVALDFSGLPDNAGVPVRTEIDSPTAGGKVTVNLVSAKIADVPDSDFEIPADFTPLPGMPGMPGRGQ